MDRITKCVAWLSLIAFLESLQLIIIVALVYSFIPFPLDNTYYTFFPFVRKGLTPNRNMLLYRIFVATTIGLQAGLLFFCRKFLDDEKFLLKARRWIVMAVIVLIPQLFLIYQVWLGPYPQQARQALCIVCALAVAIRVFWPEVYNLATSGPVHIPCCFVLRKQPFESKAIGQISLRALGMPLPRPPDEAISACHNFCKRHLTTRAIVEGLLVFFLLNALFKMHVYYYQPVLAQRAFVILLVIFLIVNIFWGPIERFLKGVGGLLMDENNVPALKIMANAAFIVFIFLFLYVPDLEAAIARVFMGEQYHTIDGCLMNTAWAYHAGCKLNVDVNNRYGLGFGVMTAKLSDLLGGCTYLNVYTIVMLACIVYFIAAYGLLRWWLKSVPIAMAGILIFLKLQPFHEETSSFYLTNPSTTVCRYFFDLPFLFMVLLFLRTSKKYFLLAAALVCSVALFYVSDTGIYLSITYYAFLILVYTFKDIRDKIYTGVNGLWFAAALALIPPLGELALLRLTQGPAVFTAPFWHNMTGYVVEMLWRAPVPLWEPLRNHEYWLFFMAMWIIMVYVLTMIFVGGLLFLKKMKHEHLFVIVLCVYGLALGNYYINRTSITNCYKGSLPYIFILCFWVQIWARCLSTQVRKKFYMVFLGLCLYALWTTHLTLAYPNVFNFSRNPAVDPLVASKLSKGRLGYFNQLFIQYPDAFKLPVNNLGETLEDWRTEDDFSSDEQLKEYYRREFNFPQDAALIDGLTKADEPVALISSFEIQMLIQANRKPFFYIFPIINSRQMHMRLFEVAEVWTTTQLNDTIKQLEDKKPAFVFMERVYLAREIPASFLYDMPAVCALVNYVRQNYVPYALGKYLVAMKRIGR